ncbi:hypothetical protein EKK58_10855 [Candidatus Dependentiae bacterium]|nr:MAG: hypothetical protein EKK58_10855 [Candidatus Dependentiae bacterium]
MYKKKYTNTYLYAILGLLFVSYLFIHGLCITILYDTHKKQQQTDLYKLEIEKYKKELLLTQSDDAIKKYAQQTLHMKQLDLKEIKKIIIKKDDS